MATEKRWIASFFIVIMVWFGILFSTVYQWANGVEVLVDNEIDLSYVTLPLMALALIYTLSGIFIFVVYLVTFNKVKARQQQKFDIIQKAIETQRKRHQSIKDTKVTEIARARERNQVELVTKQHLVSIMSSPFPSPTTSSNSTPSNITPSNITPSDITPSNITPSDITPSNPNAISSSNETTSTITPRPIHLGALGHVLTSNLPSNNNTHDEGSKTVDRGNYSKTDWHSDKSTYYDDLCSIIIPSRNEETVVRKTIQNCLLQTYKNIEVIVICHNCSDRTFQEAKQVQDARVRPFELTTKEAGKGIALNYGVEKSAGKYILILDGDGRLSSDFVEKAMPIFFTDEEIAGVQGRYVPSNRNYNFVTRLLSIEGDLWSTPYMTVRSILNKQVYLGGTGFIIRKDILTAVGTFRNHLVDDYELSCRLFKKKYKIVFAPLSVDYDEKPPSISIMLRQRARWARGFLNLLRSREVRASDVLGSLYWLSPIASIAGILVLAIFGFATLHNALFDYYPYKYTYIPLNLWFSLIGTVSALQFGVMVKEYGRQGLKYAPFLVLFNPFSLYTFVTYVKALFVKSWGDTKTAHGFVTKSIGSDNEEKVLKSAE
jgi:cellulose synthase/poly-beta-1,6-N-acetylglucosamine synthase-like glycosyltransferase